MLFDTTRLKNSTLELLFELVTLYISIRFKRYLDFLHANQKLYTTDLIVRGICGQSLPSNGLHQRVSKSLILRLLVNWFSSEKKLKSGTLRCFGIALTINKQIL